MYASNSTTNGLKNASLPAARFPFLLGRLRALMQRVACCCTRWRPHRLSVMEDGQRGLLPGVQIERGTNSMPRDLNGADVKLSDRGALLLRVRSLRDRCTRRREFRKAQLLNDMLIRHRDVVGSLAEQPAGDKK